MDNDTSAYMKRLEVEKQECWHEWRDKIPFMRFPADWQVKANPPFGGALVRYSIINQHGVRVSVYLDVWSRLGSYWGDGIESSEQPYWEVYPVDGDIERFKLSDTDGLLECIGGITTDTSPTKERLDEMMKVFLKKD